MRIKLPITSLLIASVFKQTDCKKEKFKLKDVGKRLVKLEEKYAALEEKCDNVEILSKSNFDSVNLIGKKQDDQINFWMRFLNLDDNVKELSSDELLDRIRDWVENNRDKFDGIDDWQNVKDQDIRNLSADQADLKAEVKCFEFNFRANHMYVYR